MTSRGLGVPYVDTRSEEEYREIRAAYDAVNRLEDRNFDSVCQAITACAHVGGHVISGLWNSFITIAASNVPTGQNIQDFLNQPFWANTLGVGIAGTISGQINQATAKECSTSGDPADAIRGALAEGFAHNPDASAVTVEINGPSGSWTVTVSAENKGSAPTC